MELASIGFQDSGPMKYVDEITGISVTINPPAADFNNGFLVIHQPGKMKCKYRIVQDGYPLFEGEPGYNRQVGPLAPGKYILEFFNEESVVSSREFEVGKDRSQIGEFKPAGAEVNGQLALENE